MLLFMKGRLHITRRHAIPDVICVLTAALLISLYLFIPLSIPDTIVFLIPFVYALLISDDKWYVCAFWTSVLALLFLSIISLSLYVFTTLLLIPYEKIMQRGMERLVFVVVTNLLLTAMVFAMSRLKKDYSSPYWPACSCFLPLIHLYIVVEEALFKLQIDKGNIHDASALFWAYVVLGVCTILVVLLFHIMSLSIERENRYRAEANAVKQARQFQAELERLYSSLRTQNHDFKHHYETLKEMVRQGGSEEARAYLASYQLSAAKDDLFLTGSTAVDSLVLAKSLTMKKNGIAFRYSPYSLDQLPIAEPDLCTILGNLLDNAIEGTLRVSPASQTPAIHLSFSRSWEMFYIYCSNPCDERTIKVRNGVWQSSKEGAGVLELHAIGMRSIEHIVRSAQGFCSFTVVDGSFSVKIVLPYGAAEGEDNR